MTRLAVLGSDSVHTGSRIIHHSCKFGPESPRVPRAVIELLFFGCDQCTSERET